MNFDDYATALKSRDVIRELVAEEIDKLRPRYRYGEVTSLTPEQNKATVKLNGEESSVPVAMGAVIPTEVGQTVRVNGMPGDRYIEDVYGEVEVPGQPPQDTGSVGGQPIGSEVDPPSGLTLTTGSLEEDVWIDASWTPPDTTDISGYDVELARQDGVNFELAQVFRVGGTAIRMAGLRPATTYGVRIATINRIGIRSIYLPSSGYQLIVTTVDDTIPEAVSGVSITAGFKTVTVTWNETADRDVARGSGQYEVHLDTSNVFGASKQTHFTSGTVLSIGDLNTGTQYFARVRAIDNSGNFGPWSATVSDTTGQVGSVDLSDASVTTAALANGAVNTAKLADLAVQASKLADSSVESTKIANLAVGSAAIQNLAVGSAHIADAAIIQAKIGNLAVTTAKIDDAAIVNAKIGNLAVDDAKIANLNAGKINAGFISADRIQVNSLDAEKLKSSDIATITLTISGTGAIKVGSPPTDGLIINSQGLRLYQAGAVKVILDNTGNASFSGNITSSTITGGIIRTAATGQRIQIDETNVQQIKFFSNFASEVSPGAIQVGGSAALALLKISAPVYNTSFGAGAHLSLISGDGTVGNTLGDFTLATREAGLNIAPARVRGYALSTGPPTSRLELAAHNGIDLALTGIILAELRKGFENASTQLRFYSPDGTATGSIKVHNGTGNKIHVANFADDAYIPIVASAFEESSSALVKQKVKSLPSVLDKVVQLNPVSFEFISDTKTRMGVIAEEVFSLFPEAVSKDAKGDPLAVDLMAMIALLIGSVKELYSRLPGKPSGL